MKIALVCNKYALDEKNAWLTNDLAYAYRELGHDVWVYCLDWSGVYPSVSYVDAKGITVTYIKQPNWQRLLGYKLGLVFKWLFSSWWAATQLKIFGLRFDLLIYFSPAVTTAGMVHKLKKHSKKIIMILWDFFPQANAELGMFPIQGVGIAKIIEKKYIAYADKIGLMTPKNIDFARKYYDLPLSKMMVISIWGKAKSVNINQSVVVGGFNIDKSKTNIMFGGQMSEGRGFELLLDVACLAQQINAPLIFIVAGDGARKQWFLESVKRNNLKNVSYVGSLSRDDYMELLGGCDIGLVFNSGKATVPTFPSKTIDYLRAAKPIIVAIEAASDAGQIIEQTMQAGFNCDPNRPSDIVDKLMFLADNPLLRQMMGDNGKGYFMENMTAKHIAIKILQS